MKNNSKEKINTKNNVSIIKKIVNLLYVIIISTYFIFFDNIFTYSNITTFFTLIKTVSFIFLFIAIMLFEIAYKRDNDSIALYGIELLAISIFILLTQSVPKNIGMDCKEYMLYGLTIFLIYYILKNIIIYTKENKKKLDNLSDIKEIVKKDNVKIKTKRKNK